MERNLTDIDNNLLKQLLKCFSVNEIKYLFVLLNEIQVKNITILNTSYYQGEEYEYGDGTELYCRISIPQIKEVIKNRTISEIEEIEEKTLIKMHNFIETYDFQGYEILVFFNKKSFNEIVPSGEGFTTISLKELATLSSKLEIGIYLKYRQFIQKGVAHLGVEAAKEFFSVGEIKDRVFEKRLLQAVENVNKKLGADIKLSVERKTNKQRAKITNMKLEFTKQKAYKERIA